jgi:hypothetical protein
VEYTIQRELVQILGEIEHQLGELSKPVRGLQAKMVYLTGDIEKVINDKLAELTDAQKHSVAEIMKVQRISAIH